MSTYNPIATSSSHGGALGTEDQHTPSHGRVHFSFWVTVAFTLNYILGSGFLTLPWGFEQTGLFLGIAVLLVIGFFSILSVYFILEAVERANILHRAGKLPHSPHITRNPPSTGYQASYDAIRDESLHSNSNSGHGVQVLEIESLQASTLSNANDQPRKMEITELCDLFLGEYGRKAYSVTLIVYMYGTLWAYSTVFANSFAAHLNIGPYSYPFYLGVFAAMVVPFSLREFSEQVQVQVVLSVFRIVMVSVMVLTCLIAAYNGHDQFGEDGTETVYDPSKVAFNKLQYLMPVAAYAYIFHHSVPSLSHGVKDQSSLTSLFQMALLISMVSYIGVGAVVSMYFGDETQTSSNLNWQHYVGFKSANGHAAWYAPLVAFFVVLFPAIDVASAYPLNAYTLGNNMMSAYYGKEMRKHDKIRWKLNLFRAIAAVPPIFGALIDSDLGHITDYTGLTAFGLAFVFPPLVAYYSHKKLEDIGLNPHTVHSSIWTSFPFIVLLCVSGVFLFFYVGSCLLASE